MGIDKPTPEVATHREALVKRKKKDLSQESIDGLNAALVETNKRGESLLPVSFGDVSVSIQANKGAYCTPRTSDAERYTEVELGYPSEPPPEYIMEYISGSPDQDPKQAVYANVPIELVVRWATEKSGAKALQAPEKERE